MENPEKAGNSESEPYFRPIPVTESIVFKIFVSLFLTSFFSVAITAVFLNKGQFFLILTFVLVPCVIIAFVLSHSMSKPIQDAMTAIQSIAKGNLDFTLDTNRKDELGNLLLLLNSTLGQLKDVRDRQEEMSQVKLTFITVAAHQLRTPVTGIKWAFTELKDDPALSPEKRKMVLQGYQATDQVMKIVSDLLNSAKAGGTDHDYKFQEVEPAALIKAVISELSQQYKDRKVSLSFGSEAAEKIKLAADPDRLKAIFSNVINNALEYSGENMGIAITVDTDKDDFTISVQDHGIGIPEADQSKVFNQFYRADKAITSQPNGNGLGLYLSRRIIEHHHGKIWFVSKEGVGTTFYISLPLPKDLTDASSSIENAVGAL